VTTRELNARPGATRAPSLAPRVRWWRLPFTADTWRRILYVLLALPVGLVAVPLALLGGWRAAARLQRGLARRYLALRGPEPAPHDTAGRVIAHAVLSLPVNLVSAVVMAYGLTLVAMNLAHPLRPGLGDGYQDAWGGPTLAGAWAVHAAAGMVFLFATPWIVKGITWLQGGLARRLLGAG
jgi:Putative sensor